MRTLARRHRELTEELTVLDGQLARLVGEAAPDMVARHGVGPQSAAQLLITAGDNPTGSTTKDRSRTCAGSRRCPRPRANAKKKKTAEGKSAREIMRCLKRYVAREMFRLRVPNPAVQAA